jgi:hypothetical protein
LYAYACNLYYLFVFFIHSKATALLLFGVSSLIETSTFHSNYPQHIEYRRINDPTCHSAAVAFEMYRLGADERLWHPAAIDQIIGRQKGEYAGDTTKSMIAFLENGAEIVNIRDFDYIRYIREGRTYLEAYHKTGWLAEDPAGYKQYWTAERIEEDISSCVAYVNLIQPYADCLVEDFRAPTTADVINLVARGYDALISANMYGNTGTCHQLIATRISDTSTPESTVVEVFDNNLVPPFSEMTERQLSEVFLATEGLTAVRRKL